VTRSSAALMEETAKFCTRARGPGRPFIGKWSEEGEARRAGLQFKVATRGGGMNHQSAAATEAPAAALQYRKAAWRASKTPARGG
jgi:hypothetical protein